MRVNIIAVGQRMPVWVNQGYQEYAKRMPPELQLQLIEIAAAKRYKSTDLNRILMAEGQAILKAIPPYNLVIALSEHGEQVTTQELAKNLQKWREQGDEISLLIGGPEGLAPECLNKASQHWSLAKLTFPHPLVRIIVAEQLYRAWTILSHHPYHRN